MYSLKQLPLDYGQNYREFGIIGKSERINEVITIARTVAPANISVLITGESGSGKEVIANIIHKLSKRSKEQFLAINCGAIPEGLIENELFGHEKGAYTSASEMRKGYFEMANGGTIFLDEIGELPLASQVKLLRVLENGIITRVGSTTPIKVDVRIVAATNKDLARMAEKGSFREDLYFRLKAINLRLPSLSERLEDIPLFVFHFAAQAADKFSLPQVTFDNNAMAEIINSRWKGNIRELKNFVEMLAVMEGGKLVDGFNIRRYLYTQDNEQKKNLPALSDYSVENERELIFRTLLEIKTDITLIKNFLIENGQPSNPQEQLRKIYLPDNTIIPPVETENGEHLPFYGGTEKDEIEYLLKKYNGNRRKTAEDLNISERTLYRKITKYNIDL